MSCASKNALIITVGSEIINNTGLCDALIRSVDPEEFDMLGLIASPESHEGAKMFAERIGWPSERVTLKVVESAHDLDAVFRTVNACINKFISHGCPVERITVNYTSGTKVMCSGAVLSAIYNSCDSLQYITGAGNGNRKQQTLFTRPRSIFAYQDLMRARKHLMARQFGSAEEALLAIDGSLLTDYDRTLAQNMTLLVRAYSAWEANRPDEFLEHYRKVDFGLAELALFQVREADLPTIEKLEKDFSQRRPSELLCVEMRNSAYRILLAGDADDASERLYRALEFLSQWKLATKYQTLTDDLEIRKVPPRYRPIYEAMRSMDDGKIRIGLRKSYELLSLLDDPTGVNFLGDSQLQTSLKRRDTSLLAHGVMPVSIQEAEVFINCATDFLRKEIHDFDTLCQALQFPWIRS